MSAVVWPFLVAIAGFYRDTDGWATSPTRLDDDEWRTFVRLIDDGACSATPAPASSTLQE